MPEKLDRLRRIEESARQTLQDQLLDSLDGDGRYDNGVATSLPAPARRTILSAGVAPPEPPVARPPAFMPISKVSSSLAGRVEPPREPAGGATPAAKPHSHAETGAQDPERESLERLVARLGTRSPSSSARSEPPVVDGAMGMEDAQEFLRELETQPRDGDDGDDSPPHAIVSF